MVKLNPKENKKHFLNNWQIESYIKDVFTSRWWVLLEIGEWETSHIPVKENLLDFVTVFPRISDVNLPETCSPCQSSTIMTKPTVNFVHTPYYSMIEHKVHNCFFTFQLFLDINWRRSENLYDKVHNNLL